jgi:hypothetical protein
MTTELVKFNDIVKNAPEILEQNKLSVTKAQEARLNLLYRIQDNGMNNELDESCNSYMVKAKKTLEIINEKRKPLTQLFDAFKKEFTQIEGELSDGIEEIRNKRNEYAKSKLEAQRKREEEAAKKKLIEDEKINLQQAIELSLSDFINSKLNAEFKRLSDAFNSMQLSNIESKSDLISRATIILRDDSYNNFTCTISSILLSPEMKKQIKESVMKDKFQFYTETYKIEMAEFKRSLLDKVPSKRAELEQIAEAEKNNAEIAKQLMEAKKQREADEAARLEKEAEDRKIAAELEAANKANEQKMLNLFENAEATVTGEKVQERTGYNIIVGHAAGWVLIFQQWFELEGKNLSTDAIEKKTMKQMKTICENHAHKTGTKIQSQYIKYEEIVKIRVNK